MVISMFCVVACKDKKDGDTTTPEKQDPVITVTYDKNISRYEGDKLSTVELILGAGSTAGTVVWANPDQELQIGTHSYSWNFVPTDSTAYNAKAGTLSITAKEPLQDPEVTAVSLKEPQVIYIDSLLSYVEFGGYASIASGTFSWENPNQVLSEGDNTCTWVFSPDETDRYRRVKGTITVTATAQQYLSSISVKTNEKTSGYCAYDEFDCTKVTLNLHYNAGKDETVKLNNSNCSVTYKNGTSLKRGDTSVTIQYSTQSSTKSCDVSIDPVEYKVIDKPQFTDVLVYDGGTHTLKVEESSYYQFTSLSETNAGEYDLTLVLNEPDNVKWSDSETDETIVKCYIQEAEFSLTEHLFSGEYDGLGHSSSVKADNYASEIYYADHSLTEQNYMQASTSPVEFVNAGEHTVYYYAVGKTNYKDMKGSITVVITKQTPVVSLEYLYTLKTNKYVRYPSTYVTVTNKQGEVIPKDNLQFTYYQTYSQYTPDQNVLTQPRDTGSENFGTAPVNSRDTAYYVVVEYLGDNQNYTSAQAYVEMFIDKVDNGFYSTSAVDQFAFKEHKSGDIVTNNVGDYEVSITGTNTAECEAYVEFTRQERNAHGLIEVTFTSKFGKGDENIKNGKLIFANGFYQLLFENGDMVQVEKTSGSDFETMNVVFEASPTKTLTRWQIPKYLDTFAAETVSSEDYNPEYNQGRNTEFTIYNDYGTIRFTANVNTKGSLYDDGLDLVDGGFERWAGVVTVNVEWDDTYLCYTLTCSITVNDRVTHTNENLLSTGFPESISTCKQIKFYWVMTTEEPTSLKLHESSSRVQETYYQCLIKDFERV